MAEFGVDVFGAGDGLGDFFAEELAVALAKAVQGEAHGRFGSVKLCCELGVRGVGGASGEAGEQRVEMVGVGGLGVAFKIAGRTCPAGDEAGFERTAELTGEQNGEWRHGFDRGERAK